MNGIFVAFAGMLKNLLSAFNPYGSDCAWDNYRSSRMLQPVRSEDERIFRA
jgi:hypothetical protein